MSTYVKTSMRQYSSHKRSFMLKSHPISLGLIITQLRLTKINLYLCGSLIYIEEQILSGCKFYISHLCESPHLFQSNHVCPLSTSPPCTGLEWSKKNNYSRIVTLVSMQRQTSVFGVMEPLFLCERQSREYLYVSSRCEINLLKLGSFLNFS